MECHSCTGFFHNSQDIDLPTISLRDASEVQHMMRLQQQQQHNQACITLMNDDDSMYWLWEPSGTYTDTWLGPPIWRSWEDDWSHGSFSDFGWPPIFGYLLFKGRSLTRDHLRRQGIQCETKCVMCDRCPKETSLHLLFLCPYVGIIH